MSRHSKWMGGTWPLALGSERADLENCSGLGCWVQVRLLHECRLKGDGAELRPTLLSELVCTDASTPRRNVRLSIHTQILSTHKA